MEGRDGGKEGEKEGWSERGRKGRSEGEREGGNERRKRERGEGEDSCITFSFESAANLPRATTPESTLSWSVQEEEEEGEGESSWREGQWARRC